MIASPLNDDFPMPRGSKVITRNLLVSGAICLDQIMRPQQSRG